MGLWLLLNGGLLLLAYLLGSMTPGYWAGKQLKGIDIRTEGSGSTGATNVLRTLGKGPAIAVLLTDMAKGAVAVAIARWIYTLPEVVAIVPPNLPMASWLPWLEVAIGLMAILGHSKSIFLNFTGGKSVATGLGLLLALSWQVGLATFGIFGLVIAVMRIVSASSISGAIAVPILMIVAKQPIAYILFGLLGGGYVVWRHRTNVQRLLAGTEPKLGKKLPDDVTVESSSAPSS